MIPLKDFVIAKRNPIGGKIEMAHWDAIASRRKRFLDFLPRRIMPMEFHPEIGPVLSLDPPVTAKEIVLPKAMDPMRFVAVMTFTSKMSCASFSLTAGPMGKRGTCLASNLSKESFIRRSEEVEREGGFTDLPLAVEAGKRETAKQKSITQDKVTGTYICDLCYAGKGNYARLDNVQVYQLARKIWVDRIVADGSFVPQMKAAIQSVLSNEVLMRKNLASSSHFRIHDSGDFHTIPYMLGWFEVCRQMPDVQFWCPTRMWTFPEFRAAMQANKPANLALRPSALVYGAAAPMVPGLSAGSTSALEPLAARGHWDCPAYLSLEGSCAGSCCRTCWDRPELPVNYLVH